MSCLSCRSLRFGILGLAVVGLLSLPPVGFVLAQEDAANPAAADVSQVVPLEYVSANLAANLLRKVLRDKLTVDVDESTNVLRLTGEASAVRDAGRIVKRLDVARVPRDTKTPDGQDDPDQNPGADQPNGAIGSFVDESDYSSADDSTSNSADMSLAGLDPTIAQAMRWKLSLADLAIRKAEVQHRRAELQLSYAQQRNDAESLAMAELSVEGTDVDLQMRRIERNLLELEFQSWQQGASVANSAPAANAEAPAAIGRQSLPAPTAVGGGPAVSREVVADGDGNEVDIAVVRGSKKSLDAARQLLLREAAARAAAEKAAGGATQPK